MDVTQIPFVKHVGIQSKEDTLMLQPREVVENHMQTMHASAQFTLAETQSGLALYQAFPELEGKVVALMRSSSVKFRNPATTTLTAYATLDEESKKRFMEHFKRKSRASIIVKVDLKDMHDVVTMQGEFTWFVQKVENH